MSRGPGIAEKPPSIATEASEKSGVRTTTVLGTTRLRFERAAYCCVITVEAPACDDLIPELYRRLLSGGVQVVRVHAQVLGDRTLHELEIVDSDGNPLDEDAWSAVRTSIFQQLGARVAPFDPELRFTRSVARTAPELAE